MQIIVLFYFILQGVLLTAASRHSLQLHEDLMFNYNRVVRPVKNQSDALLVKFGASLIRIIDVQWQDTKLIWEPDDYGGIRKIHMPADLIWLPDIVLYNNAAGDPEITIYTDALVYYDGTVIWKPPAIYKSFCEINVLYFPYDEQFCKMKFGMWTFIAKYVDLVQLPEDQVITTDDDEEPYGKVQYLGVGMDLSYYYPNAEWDVLNITCKRHEVIYSSCCGPETYVDITFQIRMRRKTLFYTVNLIIPCALISFLTTFVFYIPAHPSGHQLTYAISILVTLTVFFLVLIELIPPTSIVIPLFGKYLLFTMLLVTFSIVISVLCVNLHHRKKFTHTMPAWVRTVFLVHLPRYLLMKRLNVEPEEQKQKEERVLNFAKCYELNKELLTPNHWSSAQGDHTQKVIDASTGANVVTTTSLSESYEKYKRRVHAQFIIRTIRSVQFISNHFKQMEEEDEVSNEWGYVAMVIDRIFFILFTIANLVGTILIIFHAPTLYDQTQPMIRPVPNRPLGGDTLGSMYGSP